MWQISAKSALVAQAMKVANDTATIGTSRYSELLLRNTIRQRAASISQSAIKMQNVTSTLVFLCHLISDASLWSTRQRKQRKGVRPSLTRTSSTGY
ncbi:hypothetical protein FGO68_gene15103 [Halteria grandinella]|uniref:Uncharacterized protein n=1 Tax=Halteria grandinella TaxID=5974 RepID=A0A8J8NJS8_HALGN|nr:hypothetical protein FGO68_gene15103 [Halteria grandinella]